MNTDELNACHAVGYDKNLQKQRDDYTNKIRANSSKLICFGYTVSFHISSMLSLVLDHSAEIEFCIFIKLETCKLDKMSSHRPVLRYVKNISRKKLSFKIQDYSFFPKMICS